MEESCWILSVIFFIKADFCINENEGIDYLILLFAHLLVAERCCSYICSHKCNQDCKHRLVNTEQILRECGSTKEGESHCDNTWSI